MPAGLLLQASKANASGGPMNDEGMGVIPAQTQLSTSLSLNLGMAGNTVSIFNNWYIPIISIKRLFCSENEIIIRENVGVP